MLVGERTGPMRIENRFVKIFLHREVCSIVTAAAAATTTPTTTTTSVNDPSLHPL